MILQESVCMQPNTREPFEDLLHLHLLCARLQFVVEQVSTQEPSKESFDGLHVIRGEYPSVE